ncbi:MAG: beta-lactamase family protein [Chloroflexota bacterium]|nr:beta-lactamase family protein [Chloroflexota bacterium]
MQTARQREYWPTTTWKEADPQAMGIDPLRLSHMHSYIQERVPGLHGLLLIRHGYLVFEQYYQGFQQKSYHSISSATKSVVSMLVGVALHRGLLKNLDQHMLDFFPEQASREHDARKQAITLRHLLSLQTGFAKEVPQEYWRNPVQLALDCPMEREPGEQFCYDSQGTDILSGILTRVVGANAASFADTSLFKTLGIWREKEARFAWKQGPQGMHSWHQDALWDEKAGYLWKVDPQGNNTGGFGAHFTAREMAKLGYLYLNEGFWDGEQIISPEYIQESTRPHSAGGWPVHVPYGYLWWITRHGTYDAFFASGFGSKLIYVIPALDLIMVTVASTEQARKDPHQEKAIRDLVPRFVLPALLG